MYNIHSICTLATGNGKAEVDAEVVKKGQGRGLAGLGWEGSQLARNIPKRPPDPLY